MQFPKWADAKGMSSAERASGRLKFILMSLALKHTGRNSMRALGTLVGYDHSTLSKYIKQGFFSPESAAWIEQTIGTKYVTAEMLMEPLKIAKTPG